MSIDNGGSQSRVDAFTLAISSGTQPLSLVELETGEGHHKSDHRPHFSSGRFAPWRHFVSTIAQIEPGWHVISEASDGLEAVQKAEELTPDLILVDISLPRLNGIEAARQIRKVAPESKILFVSTYASWTSRKELWTLARAVTSSRAMLGRNGEGRGNGLLGQPVYQ
jgi:CheY-like chemotaxis protein